MTPEQKAAIRYLREHGLGYKAIGVKLSLSSNTIKSFCRREVIEAGEKTDELLPDYCHACGRVLTHIDGKKKKRFCGTHPAVKHGGTAIWRKSIDRPIPSMSVWLVGVSLPPTLILRENIVVVSAM